MKRKLITLTLLALLLTGGLAPALSGRASAAAPQAHVAGVAHAPAALFDRTRFLAHAGVAFYAFHHWVYLPYKNQGFAKSTPGHIKNMVKAALALAFAYHEITVAVGIANKSNSKTLKLLVMPLNALGSKFSAVGAKLKGGTYNPIDILNLNKATDAVGGMASGAGMAIKDIPTAIPGL